MPIRGNPTNLRNENSQQRWFLALVASLFAHVLFWGLRQAIPAPDAPKLDLPQSITVTLTPAATPSNPAESKGQTAAKAPPEPSKPKTPPKPKAILPKPVVQKTEQPTPPKQLETHSPEPAQMPAAPTPTQAAPAIPKAPSGAPSAEPPSGHFEGPKLNADYLHNPRPDYPAQAKRMGWEGRVVLRVEVLADGSAGAVSVAKSSGHEALDDAALEAVRRWKFVPAKRDGAAVNSSVNVPINFNLKNE